MSLVAAFALAASGVTLPQCSWDRPGVNPFMGDLVAAVDRYQDIPAATRAKLKARMQERRYDEIVDIHRDSIVGRYDYGTQIRDMHFGVNQVCGTVSRAKWSDQMLERGLVYCEDGQCILVPTVCRNVSRITRGEFKGGTPVATAQREEDTSPLLFEPPAAGAPMAEGGGGAPGDIGSFARTAALATPTSAGESLIGTPSLGGGSTGVPVNTPGVISLPQNIDTGTPTIPTVPPVAAVPEPSTWALFALGLAVMVAAARRRRAQVSRAD